MTNKQKILPVLLILAAALIFSSCGEGITDRLSADEVEAYEDYALSSYFLLRGDSSIPASRATWDYTAEIQLPDDGGTTTATVDNYPEKGQSTTVTITRDASWDDKVYKVVNVTTYPKQDSITSTTESYYILDDNNDGYLVQENDDDVGTYSSDPICDEDGTINPLYRESFVTVYDNGLERNETVIATLDSTDGDYGEVKYADFDISGPLVFPETDDPDTWGDGTLDGDEWSPTPDTDATWSSMVAYNQEIEYKFRSWSYTYSIVGVRYYTENSEDLRTSVSYERGIATLSNDVDLSEYSGWENRLYKGRNRISDSEDETVYIETVIRTSAEGATNKKVKTKSFLYDQTGASVVTFAANYEDEDGVVTSSGAPVATY
jgi:hypothetical protein